MSLRFAGRGGGAAVQRHRADLDVDNGDGLVHLRRRAPLRRVGGMGLPRRILLLLHHAQVRLVQEAAPEWTDFNGKIHATYNRSDGQLGRVQRFPVNGFSPAPIGAADRGINHRRRREGRRGLVNKEFHPRFGLVQYLAQQVE